MMESQLFGSTTTHKDWIVVDDPRGKWGEGSLVDSGRANQLRGRGITLLPVHPELFRSSGAGGFFKRSWGSGFPLSSDVPRYVCPIVIALDATRTTRIETGISQTVSAIHWVARVVAPDAEGPRAGQIRLASDSSQHLSRYAPTVPNKSTAVDFAQLGPADKAGGWTVTGSVLVAPPIPGHYGFGLYGMGPGMSVRWIAASAVFSVTA
jgi:hypothetical protein